MNEFWLVYDRERYDKNKAFVELFDMNASKYNLKMRLVWDYEILQNNNELMKNIDDNKPVFAVVRLINPKVNYFLEKHKIKTYNNFFTSFVTNDKFRCLKYIANNSNNIKTIPSIYCNYGFVSDLYDMNFVNQKKYISNIFSNSQDMYSKDMYSKDYLSVLVGDMSLIDDAEDFIVKSPAGHGGMEVFRLNGDKEKIREFCKDKDGFKFVLQPLITPKFDEKNKRSISKDVRHYIIGNKHIASVERTSTESFKANFSLGGSVKPYIPGEKEMNLIREITDMFDFGLVGIDFIIDKDGNMLFNEIEDVVGSRMLYKTHEGMDIVDLYLSYLVKRDVD